VTTYMKIYMITAAMASLLGLGGCHAHPAKPVATPPATITITGARLVLPAVKGNPAAAYFTLANTGQADATLTQVIVADAQSTMMHETVGGDMRPLARVTIPGGGSVSFAPGGKHVMVFGIGRSLVAGHVGKFTLRFGDGQVLAVPAEIKATGTADDLAGMKM